MVVQHPASAADGENTSGQVRHWFVMWRSGHAFCPMSFSCKFLQERFLVPEGFLLCSQQGNMHRDAGKQQNLGPSILEATWPVPCSARRISPGPISDAWGALSPPEQPRGALIWSLALLPISWRVEAPEG